jgi:hypothetical protein
LLFVAVGDLLQDAVNEAVEEGILRLPIPQPASEDFPIIQYADDTIVVLPADIEQLRTMQSIIQAYAQSTGLKINFSKTQLIPINISPDNAHCLAQALGCQVASMPFTYLGLPMGTTRPTVEELMPLVCAVERRLSSTALWLTYGGRLTYVNSAITPLVTFAMCTLKLPMKIFEFCDRARRHCLWRKIVNGEEKCQSLASWEMVCQPKAKGGLGVINLHIQNKGLLLKFLDKFYRRCDIPWVQLVWTKHYSNKAPHAQAPCGSFWWRDVMGLVDIFRGITTCKIKAGDSTLLWKDNWSDPLLCHKAARLFSYALDEDITVQEFVNQHEPANLFSLPLSIEAHAELMDITSQLNEDLLDRMSPDIWKPTWGAEHFKAKDFYNNCFSNYEAPDHISAIWKSKCTMKHKVFAWLMLVDRINTRDMLRRRHFNIGSVFSCLTCRSGEDETRNHLFFTCPFSLTCWDLMGIKWNTNLPLGHMIAEAKQTWDKPLFTEAVILGAWNIWKIRNRKLFEGVTPDKEAWRRQILQDLDILKYRVKNSQKTSLHILVSQFSL